MKITLDVGTQERVAAIEKMVKAKRVFWVDPAISAILNGRSPDRMTYEQLSRHSAGVLIKDGSVETLPVPCRGQVELREYVTVVPVGREHEEFRIAYQLLLLERPRSRGRLP